MNVGPIDHLHDAELLIGGESILEMALELVRTLALVVGAVALVVIAVAVQ